MKTKAYILFSLLAAGTAAPAAAETGLPDVPLNAAGQHVVINIPQQRLFLYNNGKLAKIYPVAVGKAVTQTTLGRHLIGGKAFNPTWHIPKSIQRELNNGMTEIPPGPRNPLGPVFVRLGNPKLGLGIHGTNAPSSVPGVRSHGCVRMKSPDALEFAKRITTGSPVDVIYQMASLNADGNNNLWLAAYRDPYNRRNLDTKALRKSIAAWAETYGKQVNTKHLESVLKSKTGALSCITCGSGKAAVSGNLLSLAWTDGLGSIERLNETGSTQPQPDEILPEGSEIEVEAEIVPIKKGSTMEAGTGTANLSPQTQESSAPHGRQAVLPEIVVNPKAGGKADPKLLF